MINQEQIEKALIQKATYIRVRGGYSVNGFDVDFYDVEKRRIGYALYKAKSLFFAVAHSKPIILSDTPKKLINIKQLKKLTDNKVY